MRIAFRESLFFGINSRFLAKIRFVAEPSQKPWQTFTDLSKSAFGFQSMDLGSNRDIPRSSQKNLAKFLLSPSGQLLKLRQVFPQLPSGIFSKSCIKNFSRKLEIEDFPLAHVTSSVSSRCDTGAKKFLFQVLLEKFVHDGEKNSS